MNHRPSHNAKSRGRRYPCFSTQRHAEARRGKALYAAEHGASLIEYALLIALIVLVAIPSIEYAGTKVEGKFNEAGDKLTDLGGAIPCDPGNPDWPDC